MKYDVIIIGAGPGGIFAAYELMQHKPELKETMAPLLRLLCAEATRHSRTQHWLRQQRLRTGYSRW